MDSLTRRMTQCRQTSKTFPAIISTSMASSPREGNIPSSPGERVHCNQRQLSISSLVSMGNRLLLIILYHWKKQSWQYSFVMVLSTLHLLPVLVICYFVIIWMISNFCTFQKKRVHLNHMNVLIVPTSISFSNSILLFAGETVRTIIEPSRFCFEGKMNLKCQNVDFRTFYSLMSTASSTKPLFKNKLGEERTKAYKSNLMGMFLASVMVRFFYRKYSFE